MLTVYVRSGGAVWSVAAFVASRTAALASPVADQAAADLAAVAWALRQLADGEAAA